MFHRSTLSGEILYYPIRNSPTHQLLLNLLGLEVLKTQGWLWVGVFSILPRRNGLGPTHEGYSLYQSAIVVFALVGVGQRTFSSRE